MSKIVPTIGRKLYFRPNGMPGGIPPLTQNDPAAPLDATIVYVWPSVAQEGPEYSLNLVVFDHAGNMQPMHGIPLVQDGEAAPAAPHPYAEWMPFQVGQAKGQESEKVDFPNAVTPIPATSSDTSQPTAAPMLSASSVVAVSDESIEQEIQRKGKTAPRVTPADIEATVAGEYYFTAAEALRIGSTAPHPLDLLTFCVLVLRNGFTVTGESACASPENFDAEIGRKIARQNAVQKIWLLGGYLLTEQLNPRI